MKSGKITAIVCFACISGVSSGYEIKSAEDINISGILSSTYITENQHHKKDSITVSEFLLDISSDKSQMGYRVGLGNILLPNFFDPGFSKSVANFGLIYGYLTYRPVENIKVEVGKITTNIGHETSNVYTNFNTFYGLIWSRQPFIYPGVRLTYTFGEVDFYVETSKEPNDATTAGVIGHTGNIKYMASFLNSNTGVKMLDLVLEFEPDHHTKLICDFDYHKDTKHNEDGGGFALYFVKETDNVILPLRLEYIYTRQEDTHHTEKAYSATFSPTLKLSDDFHIRAEAAYVKFDDMFYNQNVFDGKRLFLSLDFEFRF